MPRALLSRSGHGGSTQSPQVGQHRACTAPVEQEGVARSQRIFTFLYFFPPKQYILGILTQLRG